MLFMAIVLVVDKGGRGNAVAHCFAKSPKVSKVFVAPGNAGSNLLDKCEQVPIELIEEMIDFAEKNKIDLTFVGPEGYLSKGIVNKFSEKGLRIVGPTKEATVLESSKCDTKDFLSKIGVPVPEFKNFDDPEEAKAYVRNFYKNRPGENVVVKADGLAEGKGSFVCNSLENAEYAIDYIMVQKAFGDSGRRVVIEKRLYGKELMFFVLTDGKTILPLESAMDYKAAFDDDNDARTKYFGGLNPRTGGMGGYSPHPWLDEELKQTIMEKIAIPTIRKFKELKGIEYKGIMYFGLMICEEDGEKKPYVLEINVRMGDPEAQVILPRLKTDFYDLSEAIVEGRLHEINLEWDSCYYLAICAVSGKILRPLFGVARGEEYDERKNIGYPGPHITNQPIYGLKNVDKSCLIFHNGTAFKPKDPKDTKSIDPSKRDEDGNICTTGGRVLTLVAKGKTLEEARKKAYEEIEKIFFPGMRYRRDIGKT